MYVGCIRRSECTHRSTTTWCIHSSSVWQSRNYFGKSLGFYVPLAPPCSGKSVGPGCSANSGGRAMCTGAVPLRDLITTSPPMTIMRLIGWSEGIQKSEKGAKHADNDQARAANHPL